VTEKWNPVPAPPFSWWTVDEVKFGLTGGVTVYYRLGDRRPIRDGDGEWVRDARGRSALEAFGALPLDSMYGRLGEGGEAWRAMPEEVRQATLAGDPERESRRWLAAFAELAAFVKTFGPLGFEWSRTFPLGNPAADRALRDLDVEHTVETLRGLGATNEAARAAAVKGWAAQPSREWQVRFGGPGHGMPDVREFRTFPDRPWEERIRRGDGGLPHDFLGPQPTGPLWHQQDDLRRILELVIALDADPPNPHEIKAAVGRLPGFGRYVVADRADRDPVGIYWRDAMRRPRDPGEGWWTPFAPKEHSTWADWPKFGRLALAEFLSAQLVWTAIGAGLDARGGIQTSWSVGSLMEVLYLQLLEHIQERPGFGIGWCPYCEGPILRTRRSGVTQNRAHRGCSAVLRKRRSRDRARTGLLSAGEVGA
jgi:hypothetical protein